MPPVHVNGDPWSSTAPLGHFVGAGSSAPTLPIVETFHSLQGEGLHAGRSGFFIRLAGCGVGFPWCDTRHSWELEAHPRRSLDALAQELAQAAQMESPSR